MEVTRADIDRIHDRLDQMVDGTNDNKTQIAVILEQMKRIPPPLSRPCTFFVTHIAEHKEAEAQRRGVLAWAADKILGPLLAAVGGALAMMWGMGRQ